MHPYQHNFRCKPSSRLIRQNIYSILLIPIYKENPPKAEEFVTLKVYDMLGREIATLVNEQQQTGTYNIQFNGSRLSSGLYFYQLREILLKQKNVDAQVIRGGGINSAISISWIQSFHRNDNVSDRIAQ